MRISKQTCTKVMAVMLLVLIFTLGSAVKVKLANHNRSYPVKLPGGVRTIVAGDSHAGWGINPDYLDSSLNLAQDSEYIPFTYYKIKKILTDGNQIESVIISYSYSSLGKYGNLASMEMLKRYHLLLDRQFYARFFRDEMPYTSYLLRYLADMHAIPLGIANDCVEYVKLSQTQEYQQLPYMGKFEAKVGSYIGRKEILNSIVSGHYYNGKNTRDISLMKIDYLYKLRTLCGQHDIRLHLVNAPVHPSYYAQIPSKFINKVDEVGTELENNHTVYINLSQMAIPDSCFYDYQHLNYQGSLILSERLRSMVQ